MFVTENFKLNNYSLDFAIDYPKNFDKSQKYPVIFYFHGMGGVGQSAEFIAENCPVRRERMTEDMEFIIVAPACQDFTWFENFPNVVEFIKNIIAREYVDEKKVYLSGSSMGGYTSWALSIMHPELFTAAAICCGAGMYWAGFRVNFPVRAYHGKLDDIVLPRESEIMVEKINAAGGQAELVLYDYADHDAWTPTFTNHETYKWFLSHKKD